MEPDYSKPIPEQCETTIDLWSLGELVEKIDKVLLERAEKDQLEIVLRGKLDELNNRYSLLSPMKEPAI